MATGDLYDRIKADLTQILVDLQLEVIGSNVYSLPTLHGPQILNVTCPAWILTSEDETEELLGGTTLLTHKVFPVRSFLLDRAALQPENAPQYTRWRKRAIDAFQQRPRTKASAAALELILPNCPEVCGLTVNPRPIFTSIQDPVLRVITGFVIKAEAFEERLVFANG